MDAMKCDRRTGEFRLCFCGHTLVFHHDRPAWFGAKHQVFGCFKCDCTHADPMPDEVQGFDNTMSDQLMAEMHAKRLAWCEANGHRRQS